MRPIGQLETEEQARMFADYLLVQGITSSVEERSAGGWQLWVEDEDRVDESRGLLSRFRSMPDAEEFQKAAATAAQLRREADRTADADAPQRPSSVFAGASGGGAGTLVLAAICVICAMLTKLGQDDLWMSWLSLMPGKVAEGQIWRLVTPVFLHFTIFHLLFNLLWMQDLGLALERQLGTWRFVAVVLTVAVASNLAQYVMSGGGFGGMSGVVYGLFGYLWVRSRLDPGFGVWISPLTSALLLLFLAFGFFGLLGNMANAAHLSGLIAGALLGWTAARMATSGKHGRG